MSTKFRGAFRRGFEREAGQRGPFRDGERVTRDVSLSVRCLPSGEPVPEAQSAPTAEPVAEVRAGARCKPKIARDYVSV